MKYKTYYKLLMLIYTIKIALAVINLLRILSYRNNNFENKLV